ncbi:MAG: glycosyltransferase [Synergistaceae bacterium]|jgi:glycosyltransferase involved in cell wall biosynthesis|nr:glycosyltransferase [Synergistaceae bacterium]
MPDLEKHRKITIITACLNAERTIEQTLRSVLDQNYPNLEYIIVDGGSTDGTLGVIDNYRDRLALVISEPDEGIYDAFNKGLRRATGELIGILNADDFYAPWALESVKSAYMAHPESDVYFGRVVVLRDEEWLLYRQTGSPDDLTKRMSVPHPAIFLPRSTYERRGLFDTSYKITGDWDYILGLYMSGASFCRIDVPLTAFRQSGASSRLSRRHMAENRRVFLKYLSGVCAARSIIKMYLKYIGRRFLRITGIYNLYASYRDREIFSVESRGEYHDAESMWNSARGRDSLHK